jgi:hypothetical protein
MHLSRLYSAPPAPLARGKLAGRTGKATFLAGNLAPLSAGLLIPQASLARREERAAESEFDVYTTRSRGRGRPDLSSAGKLALCRQGCLSC